MTSQSRADLAAHVFVPFPSQLVPVRFVRRVNRFVVEVRGEAHPGGTEGRASTALTLHLPNSGRMQELLVPDARGLAVLDGGGARKTAGTLLLIHYNDRWVSVDARMPNRLFEEGLNKRAWPSLEQFDSWRSEVPWARGRIDFCLESPDGSRCLVETKSCNLVEDGLALFPDAPTERGTRHLKELAAAIQDGMRAAVVWFVQRDDARCFAAHRTADPEFARQLTAALDAGVEAYVYRCHVDPAGVRVLDRIPLINGNDGGSRGSKTACR